MTATFGEFLRPAAAHLAAAVTCTRELPREATCGVIRELDRIATAFAHYLGDIAPAVDAGTGRGAQLDGHASTVIKARTELRRAAHSLRQAAALLPPPSDAGSHPAVRHLTDAADHLGAGRDVLQSHFARGPFGGWEGSSHWAPAITSRPVTTALAAELAGQARALAPWAARIAVSQPMDAGIPAEALLNLHAASRNLWIAGATIETALREHPPADRDRRLLAAIPANFPPPRQPLIGSESVPALCQAITATAGRLRYTALAFTPRARWSPATTSTTWRKNALASAITGHASQAILSTLTERAAELSFGPAIRTRLQAAAQGLQDAWAGWQCVAHEWDVISTGHHQRRPRLSAASAEFSELADRVSRLASPGPAAAAAGSGSRRGRDPAGLAPAAADLMTVIAAVHHAIDAVTRAGAEDRDAVRTAAADRRLYVPTRLMPEDSNIPRPYTPAPQVMKQALLTSYDTAVIASTRAVTALDDLALALDAPSWTFAVLRAPSNLESIPKVRTVDHHQAEPVQPLSALNTKARPARSARS